MKKEIESIIQNLETVLEGNPWYGDSIMNILHNIGPEKVYEKLGSKQHSPADILFHMNTWAQFTLDRIEKKENFEKAVLEKMDWREIHPAEHTWEKGGSEFKVIHDLIIEALENKDDSFLDEIVDSWKYNFRFLINGLIQHDIYHIGQLIFLKNLTD
jgi:uncharacterized damage-inducible protein DinB